MQPYFSLSSGFTEVSIALVETGSCGQKLTLAITDNKTLQSQHIELSATDAKLLADVIYCVGSAKLPD